MNERVPMGIALAGLVLALALPAAGELVEVDFAEPGDGLISRDTETGLDWLQPTEWARAGPEWTPATAAQICDLLAGNAGLQPPCPIGGGEALLDPVVANGFLDVFGITRIDPGPYPSLLIEAQFDGGGAGTSQVQIGVMLDFWTDDPILGFVILSLEAQQPYYTDLLLVRPTPAAAVPAMSLAHGLVAAALLVAAAAGWRSRLGRGRLRRARDGSRR